MDHLKQLIREIPDWPKPGILFYDITTLLKDADGLAAAISGLQTGVKGEDVDVVLGIEARGFFFAPAVACSLGKGFIPVRKTKKLPWHIESVQYALEYGFDTLEIHRDAITPGQRVLIIDDVLATGGTAAAVAALVEKLGGIVAGFAFVIELDFLKGRDKLNGYPIQSLVHY
jgi:adenine phosphoribosyltransferase